MSPAKPATDPWHRLNGCYGSHPEELIESLQPPTADMKRTFWIGRFAPLTGHAQPAAAC